MKKHGWISRRANYCESNFRVPKISSLIIFRHLVKSHWETIWPWVKHKTDSIQNLFFFESLFQSIFSSMLRPPKPSKEVMGLWVHFPHINLDRNQDYFFTCSFLSIKLSPTYNMSMWLYVPPMRVGSLWKYLVFLSPSFNHKHLDFWLQEVSPASAMSSL